MKTGSQRAVCPPMFIEALLTIIKIWKQPKCPSTNELTKKMLCTYIYTQWNYSAMRKKETLPFAKTWVKFEGIVLSKISQRKTNTDDLTHMWNIENSNSETDSHDGYQRLGSRGNWEMLIKWYKLPVINGVSSGDLMYDMVIIVNNVVLYIWKLLRE